MISDMVLFSMLVLSAAEPTCQYERIRRGERHRGIGVVARQFLRASLPTLTGVARSRCKQTN
jgi:hypothetical protein